MVEKCRCPFYGLAYMGGINLFLDSQGNQCALKDNAYAPCEMEIAGKSVNWKTCRLNVKGLDVALQEELNSALVLVEGGKDPVSFGEFYASRIGEQKDS